MAKKMVGTNGQGSSAPADKSETPSWLSDSGHTDDPAAIFKRDRNNLGPIPGYSVFSLRDGPLMAPNDEFLGPFCIGKAIGERKQQKALANV
jgi:hypothetical protein